MGDAETHERIVATAFKNEAAYLEEVEKNVPVNQRRVRLQAYTAYNLTLSAALIAILALHISRSPASFAHSGWGKNTYIAGILIDTPGKYAVAQSIIFLMQFFGSFSLMSFNDWFGGTIINSAVLYVHNVSRGLTIALHSSVSIMMTVVDIVSPNVIVSQWDFALTFVFWSQFGMWLSGMISLQPKKYYIGRAKHSNHYLCEGDVDVGTQTEEEQPLIQAAH